LSLIRRWKNRLYSWVEGFAEKRYARLTVFLHSLADSSFFPVSIDVTFVPIAIARPKRAFQFAIWCTLGSLLGAVIAYFIGLELMSTIGIKIVDFYNAHETWESITTSLSGDVANVSLMLAGLTPFPFAIATLGAGAVEMNFTSFILISLGTRFLRFTILAVLIYYFGPAVKAFLDKYYEKLVIIFISLIVVGAIVYFVLVN
jgi:membrane protein YqaA with SNARE-associated domain